MSDPGWDDHGEPGHRIRVYLVDDHGVVRRGMRAYLEMLDDMEVAGRLRRPGEERGAAGRIAGASAGRLSAESLQASVEIRERARRAFHTAG